MHLYSPRRATAIVVACCALAAGPAAATTITLDLSSLSTGTFTSE